MWVGFYGDRPTIWRAFGRNEQHARSLLLRCEIAIRLRVDAGLAIMRRAAYLEIDRHLERDCLSYQVRGRITWITREAD
jgi:hypothetical protein